MSIAFFERYTLDIFEGPLSFLLQLLQKNEIAICDIPIHHILQQYLVNPDPSMEGGAEFIGTTAFLLFMKSKALLPKHESFEEEDGDAGFEVIYQLLDYCRFKEAAKHLVEREQKEVKRYVRGKIEAPIVAPRTGIEHLTLEEFSQFFQSILEKSSSQKGIVTEEEWKVADKIAFIKQSLEKSSRIELKELFTSHMPKLELIVTFLAMLELLKEGVLFLGKEGEELKMVLFSQGGL